MHYSKIKMTSSYKHARIVEVESLHGYSSHHDRNGISIGRIEGQMK